MHKNRLSHADLRATTASDARNLRFLLFTDSELDVARYGYAQIGLPPCPDAFSACFEHHSYALLRWRDPAFSSLRRWAAEAMGKGDPHQRLGMASQVDESSPAPLYDRKC